MTEKLVRCFIALTISEDVQAQIADIQDTLRKNGAQARWIKPHNIHMTLRFLGDRMPKRVKQISKKFQSIFPHKSEVKIKIIGINAFPDMEKPRIIWLKISDDQKIKHLCEQLNAGLAKLGIPKDREEFVPHLTIARCKTPEESRSTAEAIKRASIKTIKAQITHVTFYQSTLNANGAIYSPLSSVPL